MAARYTIKRQLEADRALAREETRIATAREAATLIGQSERALLSMLTAAEFAPTKVDEAWETLSEANMKLLDACDVMESDLPSRLVDVVHELDRRTFTLFEFFVLRESIPDE